MCINHSIKASDQVFIKLIKCFQTRMSINLAYLAQTFKFLVASIGEMLFESSWENCKNIVLTKLLLNRHITTRYPIQCVANYYKILLHFICVMNVIAVSFITCIICFHMCFIYETQLYCGHFNLTCTVILLILFV